MNGHVGNVLGGVMFAHMIYTAKLNCTYYIGVLVLKYSQKQLQNLDLHLINVFDLVL